MSDFTVSKAQGFVVQEPRYRCSVHGNIGNYTLVSTIPGSEMVLCLRCYLEKLKELGVKEVEAQP